MMQISTSFDIKKKKKIQNEKSSTFSASKNVPVF